MSLRIFCLVTLLFQSLVSGQSAIQSTLIESSVKIDGCVDESVWQAVAVIDQFQQRQPNIGQPMTEKTWIAVCHDENNLYFAFKCFESQPEKITANELARDISLSYEDKIQIIIDTFYDQRNAYWFQINPRGCIGDALVSQNGSTMNKSWDGLWSGKAHITDWGWEGEIAIPFKTMSFREGQDVWGLKLIRQVSWKNELGYWPAANLDAYRFQVSDAGQVTGMKAVSQGIGLDVVPYLLAGTDHFKGSATTFPVETGVDAFYQFTPGLKGSFTLNTDFAQTEVDDRRVNLTRFPLYFEEKRDFFLEGSNYFSFGLDGEREHPYSQSFIPFFSRRLGLSGSGDPAPILGGAKFTGQAGNWSVGALGLVDEQDGRRNPYGVARLCRNFGGQSYVGVMATSGESGSSESNSVLGVDLKLATSTFHKNKNLSLMLFGVKSMSERENDGAYGLSFAYPNDALYFLAGFHEIGDHFNPGIGFVPRVGIRQSYTKVGLRTRPGKWGILENLTSVRLEYITDTRNTLQTRSIGAQMFGVQLLSGDMISLNVWQQYERLDAPFAIHPDHAIESNIYTFRRYEARLESAKRRKLWAAFSMEGGEFYTGRHNQWDASIGCKIGVPLFVQGQYELNKVTLATGEFQTTIGRLNLNILFSPDVFIYNYLQYDDLSKKLGWQSRFVWILKPGQEIFLVWKSVSYDPFSRFEISEQSSRVKVNYAIRF